ncbi:L,D-transpeptidase [Aestuariivirga sp.]|uniref:L,D-transpeptidase n=1 Tax=Aestuariivirga sp. TaxID=2650926 RepID=UPI0039E46219
MKKILSVIVALMAAVAITFTTVEAAPANPAVRVHIDIGSQTMSVMVNGFPYAFWRVSTARKGYYTPRGSFGVTRTAKVYYSRKYDNSPMPNSVFFHGGYAIHGTGYIRNLGRPASHGCVRLHPANAAKLYALVHRYGLKRTRITLTD